MIHNDVEYWRYLQSLSPGHPDLPSPRICRLLERVFERWKHKPLWLREEQVGHLFRGRRDISKAQRVALERLPVSIRKARAVRRMLEIVTDPVVAATNGTCQIEPDELIAGTLPPFSVGQGKEFIGYLTKDEELRGMLGYLSERSPMGHIVPDHSRVVQRGIRAIIDDCRRRHSKARADTRNFYTSVIESMEAVIYYSNRCADRVEDAIRTLPDDDARRTNLTQVALRLRRVPEHKAETFVEALQSIYIVHCALHWTVEIVPLGRLDQILYPYYQRDLKAGRLTRESAQELVDAFWIKLDERALLNYRHAENRFTPTDGVLTGFVGASNYDQGGLLNQWMQQITIGGVLPNDELKPSDACNVVTELCLESARRLPLNSPTLDLRVHAKTPRAILKMAAKAILSGGAHPVLLNDDRIVPALSKHSGFPVPLRTARNYACDGCYETMFAGETEFSFGFVPALACLEYTLNQGANLSGSGTLNLRGEKWSWRTTPASSITSWNDLWQILREHILLGCHRYIHSVLSSYGNKEGIAPSPLLSGLIAGCIERGRDLVAGGANYRIFSPLMTGISTATDSLYAIQRLVFEEQSVALNELVTCLSTDWGKSLIGEEDKRHPAFGQHVSPHRIAHIRQQCSALSKFGFGSQDVDKIAWALLETFCDCVWEAWGHPLHQERLQQLRRRYGKSFNILLTPGVGTFEQYVLAGLFAGASADGRHAREALASDLSPAPVHTDREAEFDSNPIHARVGSLKSSFLSYAHSVMNRLGDGAPVDYNISETFPVSALTEAIERFAKGRGGSIATFTVGDPKTFAAAQKNPEDFNLLRVRMGGWTEFFVALFPAHQSQHRRRPLFTT